MPKYGQYDVPNTNTMVNFGTGQPNNLNLPIEWFQSVCAKMSTDMFGSNEDEHKQLLQYGAINGYDDIRQKLAEWLTEKYYNNLDPSLPSDPFHKSHIIYPDQLFMTNGNTGALHTLISKYTESTDYIIVENPTYFIAINMFKEYGLNVKGVNMDLDGVNISELENKIKELNGNEPQSILFFYMIPTHHNPTSITTSNEKRIKLAELCNKYNNFYIIADEVYHFLTFDQTYNFYPMADYHPKIISLGSFSKILAPGLRVGWIYQNTRLPNYKDGYGFVTGESGLNKSSVLDSSGGINPIGFKFIEYALEKKEGGVRPIDQIIISNINYLKTNCETMIDFLSQFENIKFIKPTGGYFFWLSFKTIKNTSDFLNICQSNRVRFHPGIKFTSNNSSDYNMNNCIRLSFSYYSSNDIVIGLERLMDCVVKYNCINIKLMGSSGKLGTLIKKEIMANKDFKFAGDIKRTIIKAEFDGLIPFNTVIIDVSNNAGTQNLLTFLMKELLFFPIIIGTTGLDDYTTSLIHNYSKFAPIAHITNFSEGIPLIRQFAKLSNGLTPEWKFNISDIHHVHKKDAPSGTAKTIQNEIARNVQIESVRTGEIIGTHVLELTNGSELIKIIHSVENRDTFAKGCINYIYWILTMSRGFFNKMDSNLNYQTINCNLDIIGIAEISKEIPNVALTHLVSSINSSNKSLTKIGIIKKPDNSNSLDGSNKSDLTTYNIELFSVGPNHIVPIDYCGYTMGSIAKYIWNNQKVSNGYLQVGNTCYDFEILSKNSITKCIIKLPNLNYIDDKEKDNSINDLVYQITNMTLFGVNRYTFNNKKYLILEIKEYILKSDMLGTISTIINADYPTGDKYNVIFINTNYWNQNEGNLTMRYFDSETNEEISDCAIGCISVFDYYLYNFIKNYDKNTEINIKLINGHIVNLVYYSDEFYISYAIN